VKVLAWVKVLVRRSFYARSFTGVPTAGMRDSARALDWSSIAHLPTLGRPGKGFS
jgi:hypothetical protein